MTGITIAAPPGPCPDCDRAESLGFEFTMAFQPIVDLDEGRVFAHEALIRGADAEGAGHVPGQMNDDNRYRFDRLCRIKAVQRARRLRIVIIAEGVETVDELKCLQDLGIGRLQGYFFAGPAFEALAPVTFA